ncbi:N-methyl-L-tryptophan oxidase [Gemmatimonas groenlandica]|uniref:N-methyl-L-tryptophan oxidase n=1 Tax=Gemmatimonas groenlandica TaxID=2732249 RepID=A0A6M4IM32_9BACT|nr:N-methyl-L-tryptophan oxidase [Gemmatimonas groenlandica]QJR34466.1 N-methyl-L-tryptophan oxidase [Gemmatimonas groenlandica]
MIRDFDVIVVGVGGMGSAATYQLAARGLRVLGIEQHELGHGFGSSHGLTRIIRLAYFEDPSYVPLLRRAFTLWRELQDGMDEPLLHVTGGLDVGFAGSHVFEGSLRSCREHDLPHEVLDASALASRFPGWRPAANAMAVYQPDAGFLTPERCIQSYAERARSLGADIRTRERVLDYSASGGSVRVRTDRGEYEAAQLVLTAGPWMQELAPSLRSLLTPERQVLGWFDIADRARFAPSAFPVFVLEADEGIFYGFPEYGVPGFKIGRYHHLAERVRPDTVDRVCHPRDEAALRDAVSRYFPEANGALRSSAVCLFTNTPDEHFIIDRAPGSPEVLLVSPCSGHGFKFCSVIGEICADLVQHGTTSHDIALFGLERFRGALS